MTLKQKQLGTWYKTLLLCLLTGSATAQSFLHTRGYDMVDEQGNKILLRGVGLGNWMLPEGYMWKFGEQGDRPRRIEKLVTDHLGAQKAADFWKAYRRNYISEADIRRIAQLGFNSVRPALNARLFITEGEDAHFVNEGFELLDNLVQWCKKHKLYVIIDMHAAPGGQTGQNIDDSPNNEPELFMNPVNETNLLKLWVRIAEIYKNEPVVAAYDLLNEPLPERTGAAEKYKDQLVPLYEKLIKAIRAVDKKHMFTLEGYNWANNWSMFTQSLDDNLFFQFHYYCWDNPDHLENIDHFLKKRAHLQTPVWVGETGERNNAIYFATTQYFEKHNIGWSFWPWKKMDTQNTPYSITLPKGWQAIAAYSRNGGPVTASQPEATFKELLENIRIEHCTYFPDVVNSMLRQLPLRLEAENYGHEGYLKSYFIQDTVSRPAYYRKEEPVSIAPTDQQGQCILLHDTEWTAYQVSSADTGMFHVSMRIQAIDAPAGIQLSVNGQIQKISVPSTSWTVIPLPLKSFRKGQNQLKVEATKGHVQVDWIDITR